MKCLFIDAQEMALTYPDTFRAPTLAELSVMVPGTYVKVSTRHERFWVQIITITGTVIQGRVNNELLMTDEHGLSFNDTIIFETRHIYDID